MIPNKFFLITVLVCLFTILSSAQDKKVKPELPNAIIVDSIIKKSNNIDALLPAKAAFFSAILPGLGQAYNKKYWKIPIVYAAIGTGVYFYINNDKELNRYRDAFKRRLAGFTDDEFYFDAQGNRLATPSITTDRLQDAQKLFRRNKEVSLLVILGFYALNIIEANVDAHLLQYNIDKNLSLAPHYKFNQTDASSDIGLSLNFKF